MYIAASNDRIMPPCVPSASYWSCLWCEYLAVPDPRDVKYARLAEDRNHEEFPQNDTGISVWPNPANTAFTLRNPNGTTGTWTLLDMAGRAWLQQRFSEQEWRVDIGPNIPDGVYLLRFDLEDGTSVRKKLIIQSH